MNNKILLFLFISFFSITTLQATAETSTDYTQFSIEELEQFANEGDAQAQFNLGLVHYKEQNYSEALKWYETAAILGLPAAQYKLGMMYFSGQGVKQNLQESRKWLMLADRNGINSKRTLLQINFYLFLDTLFPLE